MLTKAYSPEQSAFGQLNTGREVVILYVKEFAEEVKTINESGLSTYSYDWFSTEQQDSYVLKISWQNGIHIAIRFDRQHFKILAQLVEPKDLILTATPLSELTVMAEMSGCDFLELSGVLTFSNLTFVDPSSTTLKN